MEDIVYSLRRVVNYNLNAQGNASVKGVSCHAELVSASYFETLKQVQGDKSTVRRGITRTVVRQ